MTLQTRESIHDMKVTSPVENTSILHVLKDFFVVADVVGGHKVPKALLALQKHGHVSNSLLAEQRLSVNDADQQVKTVPAGRSCWVRVSVLRRLAAICVSSAQIREFLCS